METLISIFKLNNKQLLKIKNFINNTKTYFLLTKSRETYFKLIGITKYFTINLLYRIIDL